jgi:hypothetical protein
MLQETTPNHPIDVRRCVARRIVVSLFLVPFSMAGCAGRNPAAPSPEPSGTEVVATPKASSAESTSTPEAQPSSDTPPPRANVKQPSPASAVAGGTAGTQRGGKNDSSTASKTTRPSTTKSEDFPASAGSAGQTQKPSPLAKIPDKPAERPPDKPQAAATLDLASLEQRLRDTRAIGVFTKLSLKNQVDDLLDQFRAYHRKEAKISLTELRQRYNLLLLKVLTLLQDNDAPLAAAISSSREALWSTLTDPGKFAKIDVQ